MLQLADNPPISYSGAANAERLDVVDWATPWTAAYCKPRQEKALAWDLRRLGHTYFLPMVLRETSSGGRRRRNYYPLFASYIFLAANEVSRLAALKTNRVLRFVDVTAVQQEQFRRELAALAATIETAPQSVELYAHLAVGTPVRVKAGPLRGVEGVVIQHEQRHKLWIGISALGVGATIEIHPDLVETH